MKTGAPLGERWLEERLVSGGSLVSTWGQRGLNIYYARPDRGGWRTLAEAEEKREVDENC